MGLPLGSPFGKGGKGAYQFLCTSEYPVVLLRESFISKESFYLTGKEAQQKIVLSLILFLCL